MIQLLLDGKTAIPADNASIKLTNENPYLTKTESYTYEVELPLNIPENRMVFGWLNRMDTDKDSRQLEAELWVDNVKVLTGTARITSVTEASVKVQLLGESASYNYGNKMDKVYIDELDLGDWYMTTWPDGSHRARTESKWSYYPPDTRFRGTAESVFERLGWEPASDTWSEGTRVDKLLDGTLPWVAFPVLNSSADFQLNNYCAKVTYNLNNSVNHITTVFRDYNGQKRINGRPVEAPECTSGAVQPYVWLMAEKIAAATGFTLDRNDNALFTNPLFAKIFIVNTNYYIECNKCLPHWSVNEWWTQIENTFGVVMGIDYAGKKMTLRRRAVHYADAEVWEVRDVVDEYSVDVDDETHTDILNNSVIFADADFDPADRLSDFIKETARINTDFADSQELGQWAASQGETVLTEEYKDVIFQCADGHHFIFTEAEGLVEVDMFRDRRIADDPEEDAATIELKFVPAHFIESEGKVFHFLAGDIAADKPEATFPIRILEAPGISELGAYATMIGERIDIEGLISGDESETTPEDSKPDVIYIAIANFNRYEYDLSGIITAPGVDKKVYLPRPWLRPRTVCEIGRQPVVEDAMWGLSLVAMPDVINLASETLTEGFDIKTKTKYCIRFLSDKIPPAGSLFLIHNKRFVCEKIEANITPTGLDRLLTGYFYPIEL